MPAPPPHFRLDKAQLEATSLPEGTGMKNAIFT